MTVAIEANSKFTEYAHPGRLVSTDWLAAQLKGNVGGGDLVVLESDEDVLLYDTGQVVERNDTTIRAFRDDTLAHIGQPMVDVRSPGEFSGELLHMPDYPQEGAMRGGHIPGARSVPWARTANEDGTFKSSADLEAIYLAGQGLTPSDDVVAYCRIGERSSHTWFVLTHLLGFKKVRKYDGSWTEWGNAVRVPIEVGAR